MWKNEIEFEMDTLTPLWIEAEISGKYIPATHWQPAEYPTVDAIKVMFGEIDVTSEISNTEMEKIEQLAMWEFEDDSAEAEEVRRYG